MHRLGIEPWTFWSRIQRPNRWATKPRVVIAPFNMPKHLFLFYVCTRPPSRVYRAEHSSCWFKCIVYKHSSAIALIEHTSNTHQASLMYAWRMLETAVCRCNLYTRNGMINAWWVLARPALRCVNRVYETKCLTDETEQKHVIVDLTGWWTSQRWPIARELWDS